MILSAKARGAILAAAPLVKLAVAAGLYLDEALVAAALTRVGETPV